MDSTPSWRYVRVQRKCIAQLHVVMVLCVLAILNCRKVSICNGARIPRSSTVVTPRELFFSPVCAFASLDELLRNSVLQAAESGVFSQ